MGVCVSANGGIEERRRTDPIKRRLRHHSHISVRRALPSLPSFLLACLWISSSKHSVSLFLYFFRFSVSHSTAVAARNVVCVRSDRSAGRRSASLRASEHRPAARPGPDRPSRPSPSVVRRGPISIRIHHRVYREKWQKWRQPAPTRPTATPRFVTPSRRRRQIRLRWQKLLEGPRGGRPRLNL